jgi:hypothetical protein
MDLNATHQFFRALEDMIHALDIETTYVEGIHAPQIGDTLRILLPVTEEGHPVITEVMLTDFTEEDDLLFIYSTVIAAFSEKAAELPQKLSEWNLLCPLGAFGIYEEEGQLFHKYTLPIPKDAEPGDLAEEAMYLLELIHSVLSEKYPELMEYAAQ